MRSIFIDSGFPIALISRGDKHHQTALAQNQEMNKLLKAKHCRFLTTRAVLLEIGARLAKPAFREAAAQVISTFETSDDVEIIEITNTLFEKDSACSSQGKIKNGVCAIVFRLK